jgi:hypothetical protein
MNKFYRIQDADGVGPFWGKINLYDCPDWSEDGRHPIPYRDSKLAEAIENETGEKFSEVSIWKGTFQKFVYGFSSIERLRTWFYNDETIKWLTANGFILTESTDCHSISGNSQAVALKSEYDKSEKKEISLNTLLDK